MKTLIVTLFLSSIVLSSCNEFDTGETINEIESTIKLKFPENIKITKHEVDGAIGDYTSSIEFIVLDKSSINEFTERIRQSDRFNGILPTSMPHDTDFFYWTTDKQNYLFGNTGFNSTYISFVLDTVTGKAHLSIHED